MKQNHIAPPEPTKDQSSFALFVLISIHGISLLTLFNYQLFWARLWLVLFLYCLKIFCLHAGCHRLFAHRSYKTSRTFQFLIAWIAAACVGNSPLFWAAHHRLHHQYADTDHDLHSPKKRGFWWAHMGWSLKLDMDWLDQNYPRIIPDWIHFKELVWIDDHWYVCWFSELLFFGLLGGFEFIGWSILSTVCAIHGESLTNSAAHLYGYRTFTCQFHSNCDARNNWWVSLINGGEGWHNNHHAFMASARHGFHWWQVDFIYLSLVVLSWFGIVWDLQIPPLSKLQKIELKTATN